MVLVVPRESYSRLRTQPQHPVRLGDAASAFLNSHSYRGSLPKLLSVRAELRLGTACVLALARRSIPRRTDLHGR